MDIFIIATQGCSHSTNLKHELSDLGIDCEIKFAEENADLVEQYQIRHSPNLVVNGEVVFRRQPTEAELKALLSNK